MTLEQRSDADLVAAAQSGDDAAFAGLVRRHEGLVHRLAMRLLSDPTSAQDVVQETFVAAWRALHRYDPSRPMEAWLRTIALNKVRDRSRRALVRRFILAPFAREVEVEKRQDPSPDAETTVADRQQLDRLRIAITKLPDNLRESLVLTALEGLSQQEAAELLGVTPKTVETRVYRARQRLTEQLG